MSTTPENLPLDQTGTTDPVAEYWASLRKMGPIRTGPSARMPGEEEDVITFIDPPKQLELPLMPD